MTSFKFPPTWLTLSIAMANVIAIFDLPYGYYQILRLVVTGYSCYIAYFYFKKEASFWGWAFSIVALLFNPIFVISMSKELHIVFNFAAAILIIIERYNLRESENNSINLNEKSQSSPEISKIPPDIEIISSNSKIKSLYVIPIAIGVTILIIILTLSRSPVFDRNEDLDKYDTAQASFQDYKVRKTPIIGADIADGTSPENLTAAPRYISSAQGPISLPEAKNAAREFVKVLENSGIIGAQTYSENCHITARETLSWKDLDYCASFDFAAGFMDESVSREAGYQRNSYFDEQMKTQAEYYLGEENAVSSRLSRLKSFAYRELVEAYLPSGTNAEKSAKTYDPSFGCTEQLSFTEKLICESESLSAKDRRLSADFKKMLSFYSGSARNDLLATQRKFLAQRAKCRDFQCIDAWYDDRLGSM